MNCIFISKSLLFSYYRIRERGRTTFMQHTISVKITNFQPRQIVFLVPLKLIRILRFYTKMKVQSLLNIMSKVLIWFADYKPIYQCSTLTGSVSTNFFLTRAANVITICYVSLRVPRRRNPVMKWKNRAHNVWKECYRTNLKRLGSSMKRALNRRDVVRRCLTNVCLRSLHVWVVRRPTTDLTRFLHDSNIIIRYISLPIIIHNNIYILIFILHIM